LGIEPTIDKESDQLKLRGVILRSKASILLINSKEAKKRIFYTL